MFDKFGEFNSAEELNKKAAELKTAGDLGKLKDLAIENGLDPEDAEDYMDGVVEFLTTPLMAAIGQLEIETKDLKLDGMLLDWAAELKSMCADSPELAVAVRKTGNELACCIGTMIAYGFEHKTKVSDKIVDVTKVKHNGKVEALRKPCYLGAPNKAEVKKIVRAYYLGEEMES